MQVVTKTYNYPLFSQYYFELLLCLRLPWATGLAHFVTACLNKILFFSFAVPLAYSAGKNIRKELSTTGIPGLRFMSWIMYGFALTHFSLFFNWSLIAAGNSQLPDGQIL